MIATIAATKCGRLRIIGAIMERNAMGSAKSIGMPAGNCVPSAAPKKLKINHAIITNVHVPKKYAVRIGTVIFGLSSNLA